MSAFKRAAIRFIAETLVGNALAQIGEHVGDAIGTRLGKRIDPEHGKVPKPDKDEGSDK